MGPAEVATPKQRGRRVDPEHWSCAHAGRRKGRKFGIRFSGTQGPKEDLFSAVGLPTLHTAMHGHLYPGPGSREGAHEHLGDALTSET